MPSRGSRIASRSLRISGYHGISTKIASWLDSRLQGFENQWISLRMAPCTSRGSRIVSRALIAQNHSLEPPRFGNCLQGSQNRWISTKFHRNRPLESASFGHPKSSFANWHVSTNHVWSLASPSLSGRHLFPTNLGITVVGHCLYPSFALAERPRRRQCMVGARLPAHRHQPCRVKQGTFPRGVADARVVILLRGLVEVVLPVNQ